MIKSQKFKWFPSMSPSRELAQHSIHLHQRLQQLKQKGVVSQSHPSSSSDPKEEFQNIGRKIHAENPP